MSVPLMANKICIVARSISGTTGTSRTILDHARLLSDAGKRVTLVCEEGDFYRIKQTGAKGVRLPRFPLGSRRKRLTFSKFLDAYVRFSKQDLVWGHGDLLNQHVLSLHNCVHLAHEKLQGKPLPPTSGVGYMHARMLREGRFAKLIANSKLMADDVVRRFGVDPDKVGIIYPGYNPSVFNLKFRNENRLSVRNQLGLDQKTFLIGLITSGDFQKRGVIEFLYALSILPQEKRPKALIIGKGNERGRLQQTARELGIDSSIAFLPASREVWKYYHAVDLMVHPARIEEFGQVVQEALVCGTPVIATAWVGACELFQGVAKNLILPDNYPETIASGIARALTNRYALTEEGETARQMVLTNTHEANFSKTMHFLSGL